MEPCKCEPPRSSGRGPSGLALRSRRRDVFCCDALTIASMSSRGLEEPVLDRVAFVQNTSLLVPLLPGRRKEGRSSSLSSRSTYVTAASFVTRIACSSLIGVLSLAHLSGLVPPVDLPSISPKDSDGIDKRRGLRGGGGPGLSDTDLIPSCDRCENRSPVTSLEVLWSTKGWSCNLRGLG